MGVVGKVEKCANCRAERKASVFLFNKIFVFSCFRAIDLAEGVVSWERSVMLREFGIWVVDGVCSRHIGVGQGYVIRGTFPYFENFLPIKVFKSSPNKIRTQHVEFSTDLIDRTGTVLCTVRFPK